MNAILAQLIFWACLLLLVYIYAGYPVLAWLRSRTRQRSASTKSLHGTVSIVIVAHNEAHSLPAKLQSLLGSTVADRICEILIGSDGSTDDTERAVAAIGDSRIHLHKFACRRGKPSVLNDLVPQCQSDVVILADARQVFDAACVEHLLNHFSDPAVGVVSGELILRQRADQTPAAAGIGFYWRYEKFIRRCESNARGVPGATGACYSIRKSLFRPIAPETILDDVAIPMQAVEQGYRCLFEPKSLAFDEPSRSASQESIRKRRTIAGVAQLVRLYPRWLLPWRNPLWFEFVSHKLLRLVSPALIVGALLSNVALLDLPQYRLMLIGQLAFYAAAVIGFGYQIAGRGSALFGPPLMFVTLNLTTAVALWDALRAKYLVTWQKTA